ncbi:helix-turn-helix transcriptional regulator [Aquibium sp. A9E412]|uniref:AraC family transcriptional regulator n=1 Tax=Aquibium sp. A9E412 TaxID=2976767 RepID=UPI0025B25D0C|nr:helix-turn-helix transcriptional regulator [Aquibium sp. A9E412]MDN2568614.1 helix-turn-helix transcriptional regulator [Aquibium sp. A9E412]
MDRQKTSADCQPTRAALSVRGLAADYPAGARIAAHAHDVHQIVHAPAGVMRVESAGGVWIVPPGRALWMPAGRVHAIRFAAATRLRTAYLAGRHPALPADCAVWSVSPLLREVIVRIAERPADAALTHHLLAVLLAEVADSDALPLALPQPADARLRPMTEAIAADPAARRTLAAWARRLGLSQRALMRLFLAETGMTFRQWQRQARLLAALERLAAGEPVTGVAFAVGYDSTSAFIEAFRLAFGRTPGRYFG